MDQLIDQGGALGNQFHLVAAEQAQFLHHGIQRGQGSPGVAVGSQAIGKTPGVQTVGFGSAGGLALPIGFGALGVHGENGCPALQQPFHGRPAAGFQGDAHSRIGLHALLPLLPTRRRVGEGQIGNHLTFQVNNHDIVMIFRPVQTGEVSQFCKRFHSFFWVAHCQAGLGQTDTVTLVG